METLDRRNQTSRKSHSNKVKHSAQFSIEDKLLSAERNFTNWCSFLNILHLNGSACLRKYFLKVNYFIRAFAICIHPRYGHRDDSSLPTHRVNSSLLVPFFGHRHVWGKWHRSKLLLEEKKRRFYDVKLCVGFSLVSTEFYWFNIVLHVISLFREGRLTFLVGRISWIFLSWPKFHHLFSSFAGNIHFQQSSATQPKLIVSLLNHWTNKELGASALRPLSERSSLSAQ